MTDDLTIPAFLRIPQEVRNASWRNRRLTTVCSDTKHDWRKPKSLDAAGEAAWAEMLAAEGRKKRERINQLRASKGLPPAYQEDLL